MDPPQKFLWVSDPPSESECLGGCPRLAGAGRDCKNKWKSSDGWGPIVDGRGWQNKRKSSGNAPASSPGHWPGCGHPPFSCLVNFPTLITLEGSS